MRTDPKAYRWFALTVPPQREKAVNGILQNAGFATFLPVRREFRYANRVQRMKRKKKLESFPLIPGYVFVGMNEHTPGWWNILRFGIITGIIGHDGRPVEIPSDESARGLGKLMADDSAGRYNAPGVHAHMKTFKEFRVGDRVLTEDRLFEGRVIEMRDTRAKVMVEIFGTTRYADIAIDRLEAAE